jgi:hypothetical protein
MGDAAESRELLRVKINRETAKIPWTGLQRFFAQGRVVLVSRGLDLVEVAALVCEDRSDDIEAWMSDGKIEKVPDELARRWLDSDSKLWTVVVKPWVFVQEADRADEHQLH